MKGICKKFGKIVSFWEVFFCGNFCSQRGHGKACQSVWCEKCYCSAEIDKYRIAKLQEDNGFELELSKDKVRYLSARDGNHLMIQFQCELCQFSNLKGCDPDYS